MVKNVFITIGLTLFTLQLFAQHLSGTVFDKNTMLPMAHVTISLPFQTVFTTETGQFTLASIRNGDQITITCIGYKPYSWTFHTLGPDTIRIYLEQGVVALKNVTIRARHNQKADSLRLRKEFASVFNHQGPTIKQAFITYTPRDIPYDHITSPNNATTLISVNLLSVLDLLTKNNAPVTRLQKTLLKEEKYKYVDQVFSKQKVIEITHLKGDSLQTFMDQYRPSADQAKTMSDYEVMLYIKKCYGKFLKSDE
ncbi:MAG: carboxypeptidase-like regulatory domain-containing protein [Mucilaginibacter sp.]